MTEKEQARGGSTNEFHTSRFATDYGIATIGAADSDTGDFVAVNGGEFGSVIAPGGSIQSAPMTIHVHRHAALYNRPTSIATGLGVSVHTIGSYSDRVTDALDLFEQDRSVPWRRTVGSRLRALLSEFQQDHEGAGFSLESLLAFHEFSQLYASLRMPFLTVTETGELYARWKKSNDELLSIRFFSCDLVAYVLFKPGPENISRVSNRIAVSALQDGIQLAAIPWVQK